MKKKAEEQYESDSTIDNPPREPRRKKVEANENDHRRYLYRGERQFNVDLTIKITPVGGRTVTIPLLNQQLRGTLVDQFVEESLKDPRNTQVIEAVLDNPKTRVLSTDLVNEDEDQQLSLFDGEETF